MGLGVWETQRDDMCEGGGGGEEGREADGLGYTCISWRELQEGGTDRQMGREEEKEKRMDCREGKAEELGGGRQRNGLTRRQREKGCEGRKDKRIWQVCGVEIDGLSVGERCVSARYYSNR